MEWWDFGSSWCECVGVVVLVLVMKCVLRYGGMIWGIEGVGIYLLFCRRLLFLLYLSTHTVYSLPLFLSSNQLLFELLEYNRNTLKWNKHTSLPTISFDRPTYFQLQQQCKKQIMPSVLHTSLLLFKDTT